MACFIGNLLLLLIAMICLANVSHCMLFNIRANQVSMSQKTVKGGTKGTKVDDLGWTLVEDESNGNGGTNDYGYSNTNNGGSPDYGSVNYYEESYNDIDKLANSGDRTSSASSSCEIMSSGVTSDDIATILKAHNTFRSKVAHGKIRRQPTASNMNQLLWDDSLGKLAQQWANQCKFQHNKPVDDKYENIGQNLAETDNDKAFKNFTQAISNWFEEVNDPGYFANYPSANGGYPFVFSEETGHYTQMIWATITHVGCGYVDFKRAGYAHNHLYVCNYGPSGNVIDEDIYKIGKPATKCGSKRPSTAISGLCQP